MRMQVQFGLTTRSLRDCGRPSGEKIPDEKFPSMLSLSLRIDSESLRKLRRSISGRKLMTYIHGLPLPRGTVGAVRRGWSMLATNLPPAERGSRDEPGGTRLNFLLVNYHSSGSVSLATHAREILRRAWLLAQAERSGVKKRAATSCRGYTRSGSQPRGNHAVAGLC
jgi:hypothetical protein